MTCIKNANQILSCIAEALAAGRPVFMTDGTVTHKVIQVEITNSDLARGREGTLDVRIEDGSWKQIPVSWPWDELTEYPATSARSGEHSRRHLPAHYGKKRQFGQQGQGTCWISDGD